jgi:hypothetical protein
MALFNTSARPSSILMGLSFASLGASIEGNRETLFDAQASASVLGTESLRARPDDVATGEIAFSKISALVGTFLGTEGVRHAKNVSEAGARTAMVYGDVDALKKRLNGISALGFESFSADTKLENSRKYAVALAMVDAAGRESSSINKIFPVIDMNADYVTATIELPRYEVIGNEYHAGTGEKLTEWDRFHLVNAARTSGLLGAGQNRMYPAVVAGENEGLVIPTAKKPFGDIATSHSGTFKTGSLGKAGSLNIMTLCRAPGLPTRDAANYNDRIEQGGRIETVYINLADDVLHGVNVRYLSEAVFGTTQQQSSRTASAASLNSVTTRIPLTGANADASVVGNAKLQALVTAGAKEIELTFSLNMRIELSSGTLTQTHDAKLTGIFTAVGSTINVIDEAAYTAAKADLSISFEGSDLDLRWSSRTLRIDGLRVDTRSIDKSYPMIARRVISADKEITANNVDDVLSAMNMGRRLSREDDVFRFLHGEVDRLAKYYGYDGVNKLDPENTQYAGAYYLNQAWVKDAGEIKLKDLVTLESSSDTQADIGAAIVALLAEEFTAAVCVSGLADVVGVYAPGAQITPVITGPINLLRYIMKTGEDRTFSPKGTNIADEPVFAPTNLDIMDDTIIMVPQVSGADDSLSRAFGFGFMLECPPVVYDIAKERDGGTIRALRMVPFYDIVINVPVAYKVKITGVPEYLKEIKTLIKSVS